jgi:hypothetical protein
MTVDTNSHGPAGPPATDVAESLRTARELLANRGDEQDPLYEAARHLMSCATDMVLALPGRDLEAAREALTCARAAVGIASYVVCKLGDEARIRRRCSFDAATTGPAPC